MQPAPPRTKSVSPQPRLSIAPAAGGALTMRGLPPRKDQLNATKQIHEKGIFDPRHKLWTRSLSVRRGGTVVVVEDYGTDDATYDGAWYVRPTRCFNCLPASPPTLSSNYASVRQRRTLFPASIVLARYIEAANLLHPGSAPLVTVELGCGSGLVSMVTAALGARAIATDRELEYAQRNLAMNKTLLSLPSTGTCTVRKCTWGAADHINSIATLVSKPLKFPSCAAMDESFQTPTRSWTTLLLGADVTYRPENFAILACTLRSLCDASPGGARVWLTHDDESACEVPVLDPICRGEPGRDVFFGKLAPEPESEPEPEPEPEPELQADETVTYPPAPVGWAGRKARAPAAPEWQPGLCAGGLVGSHGFRCRRLDAAELLGEEWQYPSVHMYELW